MELYDDNGVTPKDIAAKYDSDGFKYGLTTGAAGAGYVGAKALQPSVEKSIKKRITKITTKDDKVLNNYKYLLRSKERAKSARNPKEFKSKVLDIIGSKSDTLEDAFRIEKNKVQPILDERKFKVKRLKGSVVRRGRIARSLASIGFAGVAAKSLGLLDFKEQ